jgi:hypothetical protein
MLGLVGVIGPTRHIEEKHDTSRGTTRLPAKQPLCASCGPWDRAGKQTSGLSLVRRRGYGPRLVGGLQTAIRQPTHNVGLAVVAEEPHLDPSAPRFERIGGGPDVGAIGLNEAPPSEVPIEAEPLLHLSNSMRSYRSPLQVRWVSALLDRDLAAAAEIAARMGEPPALVSRDLEQTKCWLKDRRRGGRSAGLLTSSGAVRLVAEGLPLAPRSNELDAIAHWFLKPYQDYRSAGALETPLSEFGCQGLELDYVGLCWGGDLVWRDGWVPRSMAAPN